MRRNHSELPNQQLQAARIQRPLQEKNHQVQPDQKVVHRGSAIARLVIAKRKHKESVKLVVGKSSNRTLRRSALDLQLPVCPITNLPNPLMNGVIIVDKPAGWTSHDVVNRMRRILGQRSIGHLGTLDPLATGVLPLVTGSLTRLAQFYTTSEKSYEGTIRFGFATNTYDADGEPVKADVETAARGCPEGQRPDLSLETLQKLAARFQGLIDQVPPPFSAKKIHGVPAYKLARRQEEVVLKAVQVEIKEFAIL